MTKTKKKTEQEECLGKMESFPMYSFERYVICSKKDKEEDRKLDLTFRTYPECLKWIEDNKTKFKGKEIYKYRVYSRMSDGVKDIMWCGTCKEDDEKNKFVDEYVKL